MKEDRDDHGSRETSPHSADEQKVSKRKRAVSKSRHRKHRKSHSRQSSYDSDDYDSDNSSHSSSSSSPGRSDDSSRSSRSSSRSDSPDSEDERRSRRRRRREKQERRERERRKSKKEKKRKRREKEDDEERRKRKLKKKKKRKTEKEQRGKCGPVTDSWGKYGIIKEIDMWSKRPEFSAWLSEVKQVNLETMPAWEEKQMFKEYMEDFNTATLPKKYYDLDAYHRRKMMKEIEKGLKRQPTERTEFNDEEQRRRELRLEREQKKEDELEALKQSMRSGMAQAMKEQAQLREEMQYQYRLGNFEAAAAIQRRLDPSAPGAPSK